MYFLATGSRAHTHTHLVRPSQPRTLRSPVRPFAAASLRDLDDLDEAHAARVVQVLVARVDDAPEHLRDPHVAELVRLVAAHRHGRRQGE